MSPVLLFCATLMFPPGFGWYVMFKKDAPSIGRIAAAVWTISFLFILLSIEEAIGPAVIMNGIGLVVGLILANQGGNKKGSKALEAAMQEYEAFMSELETAGTISGYSQVPIHLEEGEICLRQTENAKLKVIKSRRTSTMVGTRVGKIYLGSSTSRSQDGFEEVASGTSYLTTKRVVFIGDLRSLNIELREILNVEAGISSVILHLKKKDKPIELSADNGIIWKGLITAFQNKAVKVDSIAPA